MIIRAKQDGKVVIFELEGHLDFETTVRFEDTCQKLVKAEESVRLVFDMEKLKFVGSSGINQFVKVMKGFNTFKPKPKMIKVSSEFEKIFRALQTTRHPFELFENMELALAAFDAPEPLPRKSPKKKKTPQN